MNSLLLFVNSATQSSNTSNELMPLLMSKLTIGLAIFFMLILISKVSDSNSERQQTQS